MGKKLMLVVAMVALMAAPSFAAVQNVKVGGQLKTMSVIRSNFNANNTRDHLNEIYSWTKLNVQADLTDNVSTDIGLLQERIWGNSSTDTTYGGAVTSGIELETASVTMKELFYAPLSVTVGRQKLAYGNKLIIGQSPSVGRVTATGLTDLSATDNFDAIKAVLAYDPLTIDLIASRIANDDTSTADEDSMRDNTNLFGVNANYKMSDKMNSVVEGYLFVKRNDSTDDITDPQQSKITSIYTPGLRVSTNPIEGLNTQLEGAYQLGSYWNSNSGEMQSRRGAFALQAGLTYALPMMEDMKPVLGANFKYLSSSKVGSTKATWDKMFEKQNGGSLADNKGLTNTNVQLATLSLEMKPMKDLTSKLSLIGVWKAEKAAAVANTTTTSKYAGTEVNLDLTYDYTEDVKFGVTAGYFATGKYYHAAANQDATQLLSSVSVLF